MEKLNELKSIGRRLIWGFGLLGLMAASVATVQAQTTTDAPESMAAQDPSPAPAQDAAPAAAPAAPPTPVTFAGPFIVGPLSGPPPFTFDAGPFGKVAVNGILSGFGMWQGNHVPGDNPTQATLSNGQVFIAKTDTWFQFYLQAGAYTMPALATPFLAADKTVTNFYGPLPVAYLKLAPQKGGWKNTSILIGALPTLMGAESTFTLQNMNIERGLLWNQENAVNRGIQVSQTMGKVTASLSWTDGFYSNRYTWLMGSLNYTNGPNSLMFCAGGNYGQTAYQTAATPVQNNSSMYMIMYTYTKGSWIIQPYWQYTNVPTNVKIGIPKGASTQGGAILLSHAFKHGFSLAGRWEYIGSTGSVKDGAVNLIFGPGSAGTSVTVTPTFQYGGFFFRGDISWVHANSITPGFAFGPTGVNENQPRAVAEIGYIFGKTEKTP